MLNRYAGARGVGLLSVAGKAAARETKEMFIYIDGFGQLEADKRIIVRISDWKISIFISFKNDQAIKKRLL